MTTFFGTFFATLSMMVVGWLVWRTVRKQDQSAAKPNDDRPASH